MWKVRLPDTGDIDADLDAALTLADGTSVYALSAQERAAVHNLYAAYDALLGEPDASLLPAALAGCAHALHDAYNQVQKGGRLAKLRARLLASVMECPLCGAAPAKTLDHHLDKATYRALAINARNLIPSCQPCNRAKGTLAAVAGHGMIHAYFQALPPVTFFRAHSAYETGSLTVSFSIGDAGLDPALAERLRFQLNRLDLQERNRDSVNLFLFTLKPSLKMLRGVPNEREVIRAFLLKAAETYDEDLGLNHWKSAVARSLAECEAFLDDPWTYFENPPAAMAAA